MNATTTTDATAVFETLADTVFEFHMGNVTRELTDSVFAVAVTQIPGVQIRQARDLGFIRYEAAVEAGEAAPGQFRLLSPTATRRRLFRNLGRISFWQLAGHIAQENLNNMSDLADDDELRIALQAGLELTWAKLDEAINKARAYGAIDEDIIKAGNGAFFDQAKFDAGVAARARAATDIDEDEDDDLDF